MNPQELNSTEPLLLGGNSAGEPWRFIHNRSLSIRCFVDTQNRIMAVGVLQDDKGIPVISYAGKTVDPGGAVHRLRITLIVSSHLVIEDVKVDMLEVPGDFCHGVENTYQSLVGIEIAKGFSRAVRERLDRSAGCTHVTTLLLQMAPAVMQTVYSLSLMPGQAEAGRKDIYRKLTGTCHAFRVGGPLLRLFKEDRSGSE
jgi:hypothetical protein